MMALLSASAVQNVSCLSARALFSSLGGMMAAAAGGGDCDCGCGWCGVGVGVGVGGRWSGVEEQEEGEFGESEEE
jgi:hypothetical protein